MGYLIKIIKLKKKFKGSIFVFILVFVFPLVIFAQDMMIFPGSAFHDSPQDPRKIPQWKQISNYAELIYPLNVQIPQIASKYPSIVVDKYGNKTYYFSGKPVLQEEINGDFTFFRKGQKAYKITADGKLFRKYTWNNQGICTVKNEWNQVLSQEQYGAGGKLLMKLDSRGKVTHTYEYDRGGTGYWEFNLATQVWKRFELGQPKEERIGAKSGQVIAFWRQEADSLLRIEKVSILVVDSENNPILKDGNFQWTLVDGDVTRFDKWGSQMYETWDREGNLKTSYVWENHRLAKVINHLNGTYEKYGEFGIIEQGIIDDDGTEYASWIHEWQGSSHLRAWELMIDAATREPVYSGKYISYTVEGDIDGIDLVVNETNQDWINDMYKDGNLDLFEIGDQIPHQDYVYFYEVKNMNIGQLQEFFCTTEEIANYIHGIIQEYKTANKADVSLFARASYAISEAALDKEDSHLVTITFVDKQEFTINASSVDATTTEAGLLWRQGQHYFEWGDYDKVLETFDKFQQSYAQELGDLDNDLGRLYLRMLSLKVQALEKILNAEDQNNEVFIEEPQELKKFVVDTFQDLVGRWDQEYVELLAQLN